nr:MAG TPA: hypothetical protein [Caudoviricetes sp.]
MLPLTAWIILDIQKLNGGILCETALAKLSSFVFLQATLAILWTRSESVKDSWRKKLILQRLR